MKVYAPNPAFNGTTAGVEFKDGVADFDPRKDGAAEGYFRRHGFGLGKRAEAPAAPGTDARHVTQVRVGTPLRDAAVDPEPTDFLPPTNAGKEDPHGPLVVSPEVHGAGDVPLRPGPVADDVKVQQAEETAFTEKHRVDGEPVVTQPVDAGPTEPAPSKPSRKEK